MSETKTKKKKSVEPKYEKAFTISNGKGGWYFNTITLLDDKLVSVDKVGPTMRAIVVDEMKMEIQRYIEGLE